MLGVSGATRGVLEREQVTGAVLANLSESDMADVFGMTKLGQWMPQKLGGNDNPVSLKVPKFSNDSSRDFLKIPSFSESDMADVFGMPIFTLHCVQQAPLTLT